MMHDRGVYHFTNGDQLEGVWREACGAGRWAALLFRLLMLLGLAILLELARLGNSSGADCHRSLTSGPMENSVRVSRSWCDSCYAAPAVYFSRR